MQKVIIQLIERKRGEPIIFIETFFAVKLFINNTRWQGVPFYLKAGKRLNKKETCISVVFKQTPLKIFRNFIGEETAANIITFKIQPEQAVSLRFHVKVPGGKNCLAPLNLNFNYQDLFESEEAGDYASVMLDCMLGDQTLFWRKDSIESAWKLLTPVLKEWITCNNDKKNSLINFYPAGSAGPTAANELIQKDDRSWIV